MKPSSLTKVCAVLATGLTLHAVSARADVFDWNNITYAPTSAQATAAAGISIGNSSNGTNSGTLQFTLNNGAQFAAGATNNTGTVKSYQFPISASYAQDNTYVSGGGADAQKSLQIGANFSANIATESMLVTILFAQPVTSVNFNFFDLDIQATVTQGTQTYYTDRISAIQGSLGSGGTAVIPTVTNSGSTTDSVSGNVITGTANNAQNLAGGNANVAFSSTQSIDRISFLYNNSTTSTTNPATIQIVGLSNINFTNAVPEPGTMAMLTMGVFGAGFVAFRRRRA